MALHERWDEVVEAMRPPESTAALVAFTEAAYAALVKREPDAEDEAERAAIFGHLPPPPPTAPASRPPDVPVPPRPAGLSWHPNSAPGRTLAQLQTRGVEMVVEGDGWLRISTSAGAYACAKRELAEQVGWRG